MKTINISNERHKELKIFAVQSEKEIREIVDLAVKEYLTRHSKRVK